MFSSCSYILKVPLDKEAESSIIYVWLGSKSDSDELKLIEEIAEEMFNNVRASKRHMLSVILNDFLTYQVQSCNTML